MSEPKRILIVGQHFWPESFRINDIANYLVEEKNCELTVLCGKPNYPLGKFYEGYGFFKNKAETPGGMNVVRSFEIPRGNNSNIRIFLNYISFPFFSFFLIPKLLTKKYDKIFIYQLSPVMMSLAGLIIGKIKNIETTMYVLDLWPENLFSVLPVKNGILRKLITKHSHWYYKQPQKLIALSEKMNSRLRSLQKNNAVKIITLPQASEKLYENEIFDIDFSKRFKPTFNITYAGNISPAQSPRTIVSAAQILKKRGLNDIRWVIVGDGMSKKEMVEMVKKNKLDQYFIFEGQKPVEDLPKYTAITDIFIGSLVKSDLLEATIPAKVMSYIASGKPIVLAMDGEVQELINRKIKCGFAGPTDNPEIMAGNIEKIYNLPQIEREEMGKRAKEYHFKHFERNLILDKLYNFMFND